MNVASSGIQAHSNEPQNSEASVKITIKNLDKKFKIKKSVVQALDNINLSINEGEFCSIVGPSGCGKTTLLRIVANLETKTFGEIVINHESPDKPENSMIFQGDSIFPWMTVRQNVGYGLRMRGVKKQEVERIVDQYIQKVGLSKFSNAYSHQLSGGMKQRVSIARAFANDPGILLMDEPFAALDEQTKTLLQAELLKIWEENRKTVLFITHSIEEAILLSDRIVVMTANPGKIKEIIPVDFSRPRDPYKLRADPAFGNLVFRIWELLKDEVMKAKGD